MCSVPFTKKKTAKTRKSVRFRSHFLLVCLFVCCKTSYEYIHLPICLYVVGVYIYNIVRTYTPNAFKKALNMKINGTLEMLNARNLLKAIISTAQWHGTPLDYETY